VLQARHTLIARYGADASARVMVPELIADCAQRDGAAGQERRTSDFSARHVKASSQATRRRGAAFAPDSAETPTSNGVAFRSVRAVLALSASVRVR
jgi:hypothetical protein